MQKHCFPAGVKCSGCGGIVNIVSSQYYNSVCTDGLCDRCIEEKHNDDKSESERGRDGVGISMSGLWHAGSNVDDTGDTSPTITTARPKRGDRRNRNASKNNK